MALSSDTRTLKVPSAGMLAKNMRALEASGTSLPTSASANAQHQNAANLFMGLGARIESSQLNSANSNIRFRKAPDESQPNPVATFISKLFNRSKNTQSQQVSDAQKQQYNKTLQKLFPTFEKASTIASRFPDPAVLYLALVLSVLLIDRLRPHWLHSVFVKIGVIFSFFPLFILALLWQKTELFAMLREGQSLFSHPTEHQLDDVETELAKREERIKKAQETLKNNRNQLDALRKELAKDPNAHDPDAVILPSQKAAEMIRAGALGAGYDEEAAQAVEQRRKEESVKRSREEWKAKTEETDNHLAQTKESMKLLEVHAATAYTKRTRELKTKSSVGLAKTAERFMQPKKILSAGKKDDEENRNRRNSAQSELSTASTLTSTASKRRLRFFGRKQRDSERTADGGAPVNGPQQHTTTGEAEAENS